MIPFVFVDEVGPSTALLTQTTELPLRFRQGGRQDLRVKVFDDGRVTVWSDLSPSRPLEKFDSIADFKAEYMGKPASLAANP